MKVKIVLSLFISMLLLVSCGTKNEGSSVKIDDPVEQEEENVTTSSTIGGGQGTPAEEETTEF